MQQITNVVPLNIMEFDDNGYVTELNEYMLTLMQRHCPLLTREIILSSPASEIFGKKHGSARPDPVRGGSAQQTAFQYQDQGRFDDLSYFFTAPLRHESGQPGGIVMIIQDLTEEEKNPQ
ncbi:hypothetical protein ACFSQ7_47700 [Paenibacillus rhizoplanae]